MTDIEKYILTRWLYSIGEEPLLSDQEYNAMSRNLEATGELQEYTSRTWSEDPCPIELLKKYKMPEYIYDVKDSDKTESIPSIVNMEEAVKRYSTLEMPFHLSYKEDGINMQFTYYNGSLVKINTRGRTRDALDFSHLISTFPVRTIPEKGEVRVVGEAQLSFRNLEALRKITGKDYKFPRTSVRGALTTEETSRLVHYRTFDIYLEGQKLPVEEAYSLLQQWGFSTPSYEVAASGMEVLEVAKRLSEGRSQYPYQTDGIVVRPLRGNDAIALRLFNWEEEIYYSYVEDYEESFSDQYLGCKLLIYPTRTVQGDQRRLNITNVKNIVAYRLLPGSPVAFTLRSGAIADIDLKTTQELQKLYKDREMEYQLKIQSRKGGEYV